ncbi:glycosyl transferase family 1 [Hydrococcus rivularis NIES-593]|uniref:Glycosyl transferase family 1 n=1 Tax=Hydrococcus rivularis NIES-593 TaxID=1921803 RepID=A0A1U7HR51_9CYAN|nr:glycosyltransferase family 4 protein [Hydrococcus rivularis]OKH26039.1 glycosyl transferase family 1 [Hydrococcus rivularis NIES-593]
MLKVALLHFCFEDYTVELANGLCQYVELTLIHPEKISASCKNVLDSRIAVRSFKKPRIRDPRNVLAMREMMRIVRQVQPDVLHLQETNDPWFDLTLLYHRVPPLVTTIHDVVRHPGDRDRVPGSDYTRQIVINRSQQFIVHADSLKKALSERFPKSKRRVNVLPHGELGSLYQRRVGKMHFPREPYKLLFFGRIWPYKGLSYLLKAMPLIVDKIPEVKLIIAGRGENLRQYFPNGWDERHYQIINDFIPIEEVIALFQSSTVVVLPYVEASQSGVAALAYGMGTPIIASDVGGIGEVVRHERDGLLVPPRDVPALADAIVRLLSDRQLQARMQAAALARCQEDLNWSTIAAQTVEIYRQALASNR